MIAESAKIYPNVQIGENVTIEEYCIIGVPVKGQENAKTIIGNNAHIRSHTVIYAGNKIGNNFTTGNKANIREFNEIGNDVSIGTLSVVEHHVVIKNGVRIHTQVFIPEYSILEDNSWIGPNAVITNAKYPQSPDVKENLKGAHIKSNAKIGANSTLLPGIVIGENSLIGAGSVVTGDIGNGMIYAGNPAQPIRKVFY